MVKTVWKIGNTHIESEALEIPDVGDWEETSHEPLAWLPLSPRKSGGGARKVPPRKPGIDVKIDVPNEFYREHMVTKNPVYLWTTHYNEQDKVHHTSCNQYLIGRAEPKEHEADATHMRVYLSEMYRGPFANTQELLDAQKARPEGDFVNKNCSCRGTKEGFPDWIQRVFRRSPYTYTLSQVPATHSEVGNDTQVRAPRFYVSRLTRSGRIDWQCVCGAWTQIEPMDLGKLDINPLVFADARSAHDHVRRLRNGVPQNWELIIALSSVLSAAAFVVGEIALPIVLKVNGSE